MILDVLRRLLYPTINIGHVTILLDFGSTIPVWTKGEKLLKRSFKGVTVNNTVYAHVGGFEGTDKDNYVCTTPKIEIATGISAILFAACSGSVVLA